MVGVGVGGRCYAGQFAIAVVVDPRAVPDLDVFTAGVAAELQAMTAAS